ncbi:beta strand repeat-containing protein, partial [Uliginosibacterium sp. sgz301328]|uniref:beta strand repeat-containing protein n=1 Tax=Uliginosibacterium sp. sgz301328 TaxID=3243764 RepID=UPI00359D64E2
GQVTSIDNRVTTLEGGWNVAANGGAADAIKAGDTLNFVDGTNTSVAYDASGKALTVSVVDNPTFAGLVTANGGLDMADNVISNVAAGVADTDAVNVSQLNALGDQVTNIDGRVSTVEGDITSINTHLGSIDNSVTSIDGRVSNVEGSITTINTNIANLGDQVTSIGGQMTSIDNRVTTLEGGWNVAANGGAADAIKAGDTLNFVDGTNTSVAYDATGKALTVSVVDNPTFAGLVTANGGLDMAGNTISNVAAGVADTDAVNVSQLNALGDQVTNIDGRVSTVEGDITSINTQIGDINNSITSIDGRVSVVEGDITSINTHLGSIDNSITSIDGRVSNVEGSITTINTNIANLGDQITSIGGQVTSIDNRVTTLEGGWNVAANGGAADAIKAGDTLNFVAGTNTSVAYDATGKALTVSVIDNPSFAGLVTANGGLDMAGNTITNVAAGTASTDAVNVSQLKGVTNIIGGDTYIDASTGEVKGPFITINGDTYTTVADAITNIDGRVTNIEGSITSITGVLDGVVTYDRNADGTVNHDTITLAGTDGTQIKNVADGVDAHDAVNVGQLSSGGDIYNTLTTDITSNVQNVYGDTIRYFKADGANDGTDDAQVVAGTNSAAIGANSVADRANTVSVGSAGNERQIVNVAAGTQDTDAVNVSQLKGVTNIIGGDTYIDASTGEVKGPFITINGDTYTTVADAITNIDGRVTNIEGSITSITGVLDGVVTYDRNADGTVNHDTITLAGTDGTQIKNVADGVDAHDAVNVGQLSSGGDIYNTLTTDITSNVQNVYGDTIRYFKADGANDGTDDAQVVAGTNSAAIGANSVADRANTVSVGSAGNERQIVNVAAGTQDTDAVNVSQLKGVTNIIGGDTYIDASTGEVKGPFITIGGDTYNTVADAIEGVDLGAVKYDRNSDGSVNYDSITLAGGADGTKITNVAAGDVSETSTDAINGSQLWAVEQNIATLTDTPITFAGNSGSVDKKLGETFSIEGAATTAGTYSGANVSTVVDADGKLQIQIAESPTFTSVTTGDTTMATNGVTIAGGPSMTTAGIDAASTKIVNVAAGTASTDAVNVSQLQGVTNIIGGDTYIDSSTGEVKGPFITIGGDTYNTVADAIAGVDEGAVKYDRNSDGSVNYDSITLGGGTDGTKITNVAAGDVSETSTDAINGSQLYAIAGDTSNTYITNNGTGVKYVRTNDT